MNEERYEELLHDYVDGLLADNQARDVERLLEDSAEARETVAFLRSLRARAAELPEAIEPPRDLWPQVSARMGPAPLASVQGAAAATESDGSARRDARWVAAAGDDARRHPGNRVVAGRGWASLSGAQCGGLAAAAMLLMALSSGLTAWMIGTPAAVELVDPAIIPVTDPGGGLPEADVVIEIEQLLRVLYENRETLDPDTVSTIETNLRVIDRAIDRAREALEEDPANAGLARMLSNNYRHKLQLLQRANRIVEMS